MKRKTHKLRTVEQFTPHGEEWNYTTQRRYNRGDRTYLYEASTYHVQKFTRYAYGSSVPLKLEDLKRLAREDPQAYVHFLVSDQVSTAWVMVKNIRIMDNQERFSLTLRPAGGKKP